MNEYLKKLSDTIKKSKMENTYKMAWIRSIVETCDSPNPKNEIQFKELSPLIFKYYWNQSIFFNLEQGSNLEKRPIILQIVKDKIKSYQETHGYKPVFYTNVKDKNNIPIAHVNEILCGIKYETQRMSRKYTLPSEFCNPAP